MKLPVSWITRQRYVDVDIDHSLMCGKLKIKNKVQIFESASYGLLSVMSLFLSTAMLYPFRHTLPLFIISLSLTLLVAFGLYQENRLIRALGKDLQANKKAMVNILKDRYDTELVIEGDRIVSYYRGATNWNFALRIIVLFDRNEVFITIARFNQNAVKSVFHEFFSFLQTRHILRDFHSLISSNGLDKEALKV